MKNEQAIRRLEDLQRLYLGNEKFTADIEAIGIAIDALNKQPCEDCISRKAVKEQMIKYGFKAPDMTVTEFVEDCLPSVTPKPKTGHWEMCEDADGIYGVCDICGIDADFSHKGEAYPYCPNCGAKMEGEDADIFNN